MIPLADLPSFATVREAAAHLSYDQAVQVAASILDDLKSGKLQRPYSDGVRMSLLTCAAVFSQRVEVMTCSHDGQAGRFCADCGNRLHWECPCGASHHPFPAAKFCSNCGKPRPPWAV